MAAVTDAPPSADLDEVQRSASLVLVSNRLPTTLHIERGAVTFTPSAGGLATALIQAAAALDLSAR